ncbi:glycosyltransferase family 2 protein [Ensifer sp. IC3342]|nr:glycosyltransferase family 2 protein [Ensifer sp. BRP08]MCA1448743.1 glycosyltransferase family 2 protein [Ensifer sp. IC3342]
MDRPQAEDRQHGAAVPGPNGTGSLAVVIVTYNSASVLPGLLDSLPAGLEGIANYQVIVVDNASRDGSADLALAHPIGARVIRMGRNAGYAAGINAATATVAPYADLLVLNPDVRLHPGAARHLVDRLTEASVGVVVPQILGEDGKVCRSLRREPSAITAWSDALIGTKLAALIGIGEIVADPILYAQGGRIEWATGAVLAISARARLIVGDWDESFFLYSEEVDYMERVRRSALSVVYDTNARAVHIGGAYQRNPYLSALMTSNRVRYYRRHHGPIATMLFRLAIIVGESMRVVLGPGHRAALRAALTLKGVI